MVQPRFYNLFADSAYLIFASIMSFILYTDASRSPTPEQAKVDQPCNIIIPRRVYGSEVHDGDLTLTSVSEPTFNNEKVRGLGGCHV